MLLRESMCYARWHIAAQGEITCLQVITGVLVYASCIMHEDEAIWALLREGCLEAASMTQGNVCRA